MTEKTCATCRWWIDVTSQYDEQPYWHPEWHRYDETAGELVHGPLPDRWGECSKVTQLRPEGPQVQFYVMDGSDYAAHLHTRETFGCNQWEATDPAEEPT